MGGFPCDVTLHVEWLQRRRCSDQCKGHEKGWRQKILVLLHERWVSPLNGADCHSHCPGDSVHYQDRASCVIVPQVVAAFPARPHPTLLAVRSSANVEDLAGMSAAGLYDSIVGHGQHESPAVS